jgi:SAM-dependent methyltransferase
MLELADGVAAALRPRAAGVPPRRLRTRVGAPSAREFAEGGEAAARQLAAALTPRDVREFGAVLDFGCGSGRVLVPFRQLNPAARLSGVDVDVEAITWAAGHIPAVAFRASEALPPLPFDQRAFDLIYSISVFSHLGELAQDAWLAELARVLPAGGTLLLSTHGQTAFEAFRSGAVHTAWCEPGAFDRGPLAASELVSIPYRANRWSRGDLPGVGEGYGLTFHGEAYIREHWGRFLDVERILPQAVSGWQDLVVAKRRD